jgi:hypothetical protein
VEETAYRGAAWFLLFAKYNSNYLIEEVEVGRASSVNGGEEERI